MADGVFASKVSATRDDNILANPIFVQLSDGTLALGVTSGALDVNIDNASIVVTATDLDIRALSQTTDHVLIYGNTVKDGSGTDYVPLLDADGKVIISNPGGTEYSEDVATPATIVGTATMFERDDVLSTLTPIEGDWSSFRSNAKGALWVELDPTNPVVISDGGGSITIDGTVAATQSGVWDIGTVTTLTGITNDVNIADGGNVISIDDAGGSITVDGSVTVTATDLDIRNLSASQDNVAISDGTDTLAVNTDGSINVNIVSATIGGEIHDYDTSASVASDTADNHDYTVTVATTLLLKSIIVAGSGNIKFEIQVGPVASLATVAVGFLNGKEGDTQQVFFDPAIEVPDTSTGTVRVIRTNRQGAATDVYSTIIGQEV